MKPMNYYIVRFSDLSKEKQTEIKEDLRKRIIKDKEMMAVAEIYGDDSIDIVVQRACDTSWIEWGIFL
jgi:hypothetical protein